MTKNPLIVFILFSICCSGQTKFYDETVLQKIEVQFNQNNWDYILDTATLGTDGYVMAKWIKINGTYFDSVGVKYKGNSSYDSTRAKNPIHFELDAFKKQDYSGIKDIKLSNGYADPSMVREVLSYNIARAYMDAPQSNFAQLYINGKYIGVYTNTEPINKGYCNNHFLSKDGVFVKCNPNLVPSPAVKSNLKYLPGDSSAYYNYYELKSDYGWKYLQALCDTITNNPTSVSTILDMDRAIWMLAFNTLLVNLDSYSGVFAQNYYLYKDKTGRFNPLIWDLNMCFGGFPFVGASNSSFYTLLIPNMQSMPINIHAADSYWPLINIVHNNSTYKKMYVAHMRTMINEYFSTNLYISKYKAFQATIDTAVASDTRKFYNYSQFQQALVNNYPVTSYSVPGVQTLMSARVSYLNGTSDFTASTPTISSVTSSVPQLNSAVTIKCQVNNAQLVYLNYRFSPTEKFVRVQMYDDGAHGDGGANDNIFASNFTQIANNAQYYIYAENAGAGIFSPERAEHEFHTVDVYKNPEVGQVVINEFLADNKSDVKNESHLSEDWIELYNPTGADFSLANYFLSDDLEDKPKYIFPKNAFIEAHSYLTIWADNLSATGKPLHANFKLNNTYGSLILSNGGYKILDTYTYGEQLTDVSQGRCPDGYGAFTILKYPSFGLSNCIVGINEQPNDISIISVFPNPASEITTVTNNSGNTQQLAISDMLGRVVFTNKLETNLNLNTSQWPNGIYLVSCAAGSTKIIVNH